MPNIMFGNLAKTFSHRFLNRPNTFSAVMHHATARIKVENPQFPPVYRTRLNDSSLAFAAREHTHCTTVY